MIYLDASAALAHLLVEARMPTAEMWGDSIVSSRLLVYEVWNVVNARGLRDTHAEDVRALLGRVAFLEMIPEVLQRATEPFGKPLRTLDALHVASALFLRDQGVDLAVATYDERMREVASSLELRLYRGL